MTLWLSNNNNSWDSEPSPVSMRVLGVDRAPHCLTPLKQGIRGEICEITWHWASAQWNWINFFDFANAQCWYEFFYKFSSEFLINRTFIILSIVLLSSCPVVSNSASLWTAACQASLSPTIGVCPGSCPLHRWCHPAISPIILFVNY